MHETKTKQKRIHCNHSYCLIQKMTVFTFISFFYLFEWKMETTNDNENNDNINTIVIINYMGKRNKNQKNSIQLIRYNQIKQGRKSNI